MIVLNLLLKRRGVLYEAYRLSGEAQHFYRLQELEYLLKQFSPDQIVNKMKLQETDSAPLT